MATPRRLAKVPAGQAVCRFPPTRSLGRLEELKVTRREVVMYAQVGDRLLAEGDPARTGLIIGVPHADGSPPYIVKWLANGQTAMVFPGAFARIIPASHPAGTALGPLALVRLALG
jgi:hypothetical protein